MATFLGLNVTLLAAVLVVLTHGTSAAPGYGQPCNETEICDRTAGYDCVTNGATKVCLCPAGTVNDFNNNQCRAPPESPCTILDKDYTIPIKRCAQNAACHPYADTVTSGNGICFCDNGYTQYMGMCVGLYGSTCYTSYECQMTSLLTCSSNKCACEGREKQYWNGKNCISLLNENCNKWGSFDRNCPANAVCNNQTNVCECKVNTTPSEDRMKCLGKLNAECAIDDECINDLQCIVLSNATTTTTTATTITTPPPTTTTTTITTPPPTTTTSADESTLMTTPPGDQNGTYRAEINFFNSDFYPNAVQQCGCKDDQKYSEAPQPHCIVKAGGDCSILKTCTEHANCDGVTSTCKCDKNFYAIGGTCVGHLGADCSADNNICDGNSYYECKNNATCDCQTGYKHDGTRCIGYVNSVCSSNDECNAATMTCATSTKKCQCKPGFTVDGSSVAPSQTCAALHGTGCSADIPCNGADGLTCNGTCECANLDMEYDGSTCIGLAGTPCVGSNQRCTGNATCTVSNDQSICQCKDGFQANDQKHCISGAISTSAFALLISLCLLITWKV